MIHEKTLLEGRRPCPNCSGNVYYHVIIRGEDVYVEEFETYSPNEARDAGVKD